MFLALRNRQNGYTHPPPPGPVYNPMGMPPPPGGYYPPPQQQSFYAYQPGMPPPQGKLLQQ